MSDNFFSTKGRIGRLQYFIRTFLLITPGVIIELLTKSNDNVGLALLVSFVFLASGILQIIQAIKRLHDLNKSSWWILLSFIPIINIGLGLYLLFWPGLNNTNNKGNQNNQLSELVSKKPLTNINKAKKFHKKFEITSGLGESRKKFIVEKIEDNTLSIDIQSNRIKVVGLSKPQKCPRCQTKGAVRKSNVSEWFCDTNLGGCGYVW